MVACWIRAAGTERGWDDKNTSHHTQDYSNHRGGLRKDQTGGVSSEEIQRKSDSTKMVTDVLALYICNEVMVASISELLNTLVS